MDLNRFLDEALVGTALASLAHKVVKKHPTIRNVKTLFEKALKNAENEVQKKRILDNKENFIQAIKFALKDA